jgi:hypothetical protein
MAWENSKQRYRAAELVADDHHPTCPHCHDLSTDGAKWCVTCDTWLLDRGPTATELAGRQRERREAKRQQLYAGNARHRTNGSRVWGTDYSGHDAACGYRIVFSWPAGSESKHSEKERHDQAYKHAARLNAAQKREDVSPKKGTEE